eukprot:jgi/Chlat1/8012/Chrsp7S07759
MALRVIVFPVYKRQWAFLAIPPPVKGSKTAVDPATIGFRSLLRELSAVKDWSTRAVIAADRISAKAEHMYSQLGTAPEGSWKHRTYRLIQKLVVTARPEELFLRSVSTDALQVELVFPSSLHPRLVRRRVRLLASRCLPFHRWWCKADLYFVPVTSLGAILPAPNVFLFWNLYRVISHWRAWRGSEFLLRMSPKAKQIAEASTTDSPQADTSLKAQQSGDEVSTAQSPATPIPAVAAPSEELEALAKPAERWHAALSREELEAICSKFQIDINVASRWLGRQ